METKEELKTLKDIELWCVACQDEECCERKRQSIKQEAIKWVKEWNKECITSRRKDSGVYQYHRRAKIIAFKKFFNISEKDLK